MPSRQINEFSQKGNRKKLSYWPDLDYHSGGGSDYHYGDDHHYRSDNGPEAAGESADQKDEGSDKKTLFGRFGQSLGNRLANLVSAIKTGRQPTASEVDDLKID